MDYYFVFDEIKTGQSAMYNIIGYNFINYIILVICTSIRQCLLNIPIWKCTCLFTIFVYTLDVTNISEKIIYSWISKNKIINLPI